MRVHHALHETQAHMPVKFSVRVKARLWVRFRVWVWVLGLCIDRGYLAQGYPNLTTIMLSRCRNITGDAVRHLSQDCPNLTSVNFKWCKKITGDALKHLAQGCPKLTSINLCRFDSITRLGFGV